MNNAQWSVAASHPAAHADRVPRHVMDTSQRHPQPHSTVQTFKPEPESQQQPHRGEASSSSPSGGRSNLQSCQFCRKRKIKCDKLEGGCTQCVRAKTECVYPVSQRKGRPRKAGSKQGVPAATPREEQLLRKIWRLETTIDSLTGRGGQGAMSGLDQSVEHPLREQLDRLVVGRSYVSDAFWTDEVKEVPEDSDEESYYEDGDQPPYSVLPSRVSELYHSNFIFPVDLTEEDLTSLHPPVTQIPVYWDIYLENCEVILAVFHKPTTARIIHQAQEDLSTLSKANDLLMFSIYFATINSMSEDEVLHRFGGNRGVLLRHYETAIQRALVRVKFLNTQDLTVLQAFVLYLICIRHTDGAVVWSLTGLAIRLSQGMNIDRDGEIFNLSPLQTEMRRRIWHQISILDVRASEAKGCFPTPLFYDTKIPTNINDDDISTETREYPKHRDEITDMTNAILRYETCEIGRRLRRPGLSSDAKEMMIKEFKERLDNKYLRRCRERGGMYHLSDLIASVVTSRMFLMLYKRRSEENNEKPGARDQLFKTSTELIEYSYDIYRHPDGSRWNWLFKTYIQWHAVNIVLHEILARVPSPATDRAWRIIDTTSSDWEMPLDRPNQLLYNSITLLLDQAQQYRALQQQRKMQHQIYTNPDSQNPQNHQGHEQHIDSQQMSQPSSMAYTSQAGEIGFPDPNNPNAAFYLQQQQQHPPLSHPEMFVNQGTGLLDDQIGAGAGVNVTQSQQGLPSTLQTWYAPLQNPSGTTVGEIGGRVVASHNVGSSLAPLSLEDQNMVYGPDETWSEYNNLLKNYSLHGGLE